MIEFFTKLVYNICMSMESKRNLISRILMALLVLTILICAFSVPWRSIGGMDSRTYFEMIQGIARTGVPVIDNGPVDRFPELAARWNMPVNGRLWGTYPPLYPYLMAPVYRMGGLVRVNQANMVMLAMLALVGYGLSLTVTRNPILSVLAAAIMVFANGIAVKGFKPTPYILATLLITVSALCVLRSRHRTRSAGWAFLGGLTAGLGSTAHLLVFPMAIGILAASVIQNRRQTGAVLGGILIPVTAMAGFNALRFGSWNPVSYGPCIWRTCKGSRQLQTIHDMVDFGWPVIVWTAGLLAVLLILRKHRLRQGVVGSIALALLLLIPVIRTPALRYLVVAWGLLVDLSGLTMDPPYTAAADGIGVLRGRHVMRSLIQCLPVVILIPLARVSWRRQGAVLLLPVLGLAGGILLRSNMPWDNILGHSSFHHRYFLPGIPLMVVLAVSAVQGLAWRYYHLLAGLAATSGLAVYLAMGGSDEPLIRRAIIVMAPIGLAGAAAACVGLLRRFPSRYLHSAALWSVTLVVGWGFAVHMGIDLNIVLNRSLSQNQRQEKYRDILPRRFAVLGMPRTLNPFLALKDTHDIQYADLSEVDKLQNLDELIQHWLDDNRFVYWLPQKKIKRSPWQRYRLLKVPGGGRMIELVPRNQPDS